MKWIRDCIGVCIALSLTACGGGHLSIDLPGGERTLGLSFRAGQAVQHRLPVRISGGVRPYESSIEGCPDWVILIPDQRILAGTAPVADSGKTFFCTFSVTESDPGFRPARSASYGLQLEVTGIPTQPLALPLPGKISLRVETFYSAALVAATGGVQPYTYSLTCAGGMLPSGMGFAPETRTLAGTPDSPFRDSCTYTVTDSSQPAATVSRAVEVEVTAPTIPPLELTQILENTPDDELTLKIGRRSQRTFQAAAGGVAPYTYELVDCMLPDGLGFHPSTRVLSGTPDEEYRGPNCTYRVTDSSSPPASVSLSFVLVVEPLEASDVRFRTRTVEPGQGLCVIPGSRSIQVATLPGAPHGEDSQRPRDYGLPGADEPDSLLRFDSEDRVLRFTNPDPPPVLGTPNTYRYLVGTTDRVGTGTGVDATNADDALCLDFQVNSGAGTCPEDDSVNPVLRPGDFIHVQLRLRDDAFWDGNANNGRGEYRCPDTTAPPPRPPITEGVSNPVHEALGPVHARRATEVAHAAVRDRVRGWSPGSEQASFTVAPEVGLASLSGQHEGFDYTGNSESVTFGAETGAGAWQAGLVASFTRTELRYRAEAALAELGYRSGEHDTELLSLHPFAAWHGPTGGHLWASLGGGTGHLRHRDDLGFPSWSRSDVRLLAHAVGASVPVADVLSGELQAEAGIEWFSFDIKGGGRISSSLPTMRGRDYSAGLAWSAPIPGAPSVSMAYKHLTGDGPEGGQLEATGSVSVDGILHPRLALVGNARGSFGVGDYEQKFWRLGGGVRFAPDSAGRGFGLDLDARLMSLADGGPAGVGIRSEAGYGLWSDSFSGMIRPYVGLIRYSGDQSVRRTLGLDLRGTSNWLIKFEVHDDPGDQSLAEVFLRHRF